MHTGPRGVGPRRRGRAEGRQCARRERGRTCGPTASPTTRGSRWAAFGLRADPTIGGQAAGPKGPAAPSDPCGCGGRPADHAAVGDGQPGHPAEPQSAPVPHLKASRAVDDCAAPGHQPSPPIRLPREREGGQPDENILLRSFETKSMPGGQGGSKERLARGVTWGQTPQKHRFSAIP